MSNPYDPNAPPPPNAPWGAPPSQPGYQQPPPPAGAWNAPPQGPQGPYGPYAAPPGASGGGGTSKWLIGCLVALLVVVSCCGGTMFFGWRVLRTQAATVVQEQAAAMGAGSYLEVCRHNSPTLQAATPCDQYVAWLNTNAPWFAGSTIEADGVEFQSDPAHGFHYLLRVSGNGPRGSGRLTFTIVMIGQQYYVNSIVPNQ